MRVLAFLAILPAAAPVYFFGFWRAYDFWRARRALFYAYAAATFASFGVPVYVWREQVLALRFDFPVAVQAVGWVAMTAGTIFGFVADRQIGMHVRSFGPHFAARGRIRLCKTGAYGVVRHPIYASGIFFQAGAFLATGFVAVLGACVIFTLGALWFTQREEERTIALLEDPGEYERYRARVPALLPWPWHS